MARLPQKNYATKAGESNPKDRCQTPAWAVPPILKYLPKAWTLWESAAGEGLLVDALEINGYTVIATELLTGTDYFGYEPECYHCQVTNVPFSRGLEWMTRAIALGKPFSLLAPSPLMFTKGGGALIRKHGIEVLCPTDRIDFKMPNLGWDGNGAQFHSSWYTWQLGIGQFFTYVDLDKPKRSRKSKQTVVRQNEVFETQRDIQTELF